MNQLSTKTDRELTLPLLPGNESYNQPSFSYSKGDSLELMKELHDQSVDCILTDPPYKYLKNQKLEVDFDEKVFFNEAKRVLKKNGFIVLFGRGRSFYRWNTLLGEIGFNFKEEIIWNKSYTSSPHNSINRVHETISISTVDGILNKILLPYEEIKQNPESILVDLKRIQLALNNSTELKDIAFYLKTGIVNYQKLNKPLGNGTTNQTLLKQRSRGLATIKSIKEGMREKSIITEIREHYKSIHPTQKPIRLIERLLALTTREGDLVLDPFSGSCSTGIACLNLKRKFIGFEIDEEYYLKSVERIKAVEPRLF